jgi:hypothetical protein
MFVAKLDAHRERLIDKVMFHEVLRKSMSLVGGPIAADDCEVYFRRVGRHEVDQGFIFAIVELKLSLTIVRLSIAESLYLPAGKTLLPLNPWLLIYTIIGC